MVRPSAFLRIAGYVFLSVPPFLLLIYLVTQFPRPQESLHIYPSLASVPRSNRVWEIYNEDYFPGGGYAVLPYGRVRYWLMGPEDGEKVVLIPGLLLPAIIWKNVAPQLAFHGFRVLLYDLYGRGFSDAPSTTYDSVLYTTQLALLMQYLGWQNANVVGVSMGGAIASAFHADFPYLVDTKVALISPAGTLETTDLSRTSKFMSSALGQMLSSSFLGRMYLRSMAESNSTDPVELARLQAAYLPGYNAAVGSSIRQGPVRGQQSSFQLLHQSNKKILMVYGTADNTIPPRSTSTLISLLPRAQVHVIEGGTHSLILEETLGHSVEVTKALIEFLSS